MEKRVDDITHNPFSFVGIILVLVFLNWVIMVIKFYSIKCCKLQFLMKLISYPWKFWVAESKTTSCGTAITGKLNLNGEGNVDDEEKPKIKEAETETTTFHCNGNRDDNKTMCIVEVKMMMDRLLNMFEEDGDKVEDGETNQIDSVFKEDHSKEEVQEAFDLFDENKDGFIDSGELKKVLFIMVFMEASEEECRMMIEAYDENGDGRIDFHEFLKLIDQSFH